MKCIKCQIENKETAKFCRGCGCELAVVDKEQLALMKTCTQCQHVCKPEAKFCLQCGHSFLSSIAKPTVIVEPATGKICPKCQAVCKPEAKFCLKCGHDFSTVSMFPETEAVEVVAQPPVEIRSDAQHAGTTKSCPDCSNTLKQSAKFCGKCGFSFVGETHKTATETIDLPTETIAAIAVAVPAEESQSCPTCGGTLKENAKFCGNCGLSFSAGLQSKPLENLSSPQIVEHVQASVLNRPAPRPEPESRPQVAQHEAVRETKSGGKIVLAGALLAGVIAVVGGGYWWNKVRNAGTPVIPAVQTAAAAKAEPVSAVPVATTVASAPVTASVVDAKLESAPKAGVAVKNETPSVAQQIENTKETKKEKAPVNVKKEAAEKSKHSSAVAGHETRPAPVPPVTQPVVPDAPIDGQSETMLSMADKMYAGRSYTSVLDLARPVLKKYPGNSHATRLINNSRAAIDRQQEEFVGKLKELGK